MIYSYNYKQRANIYFIEIYGYIFTYGYFYHVVLWLNQPYMVDLTMMMYCDYSDFTRELPKTIREERLVQRLQNELNCNAVGLLKLDGEYLKPVALAGLVAETLGRRFEITKHPRLSAILSDRQVVHFPPGSTLPDPYDGLLEDHVGEPLPVHDCMGISLYVEDRCWGVLTLDSTNHYELTQEIVLNLPSIARYCEATLRVSLLEAQIHALRMNAEAHDEPNGQVSLDEPEIIAHSEKIKALLHELDVVADSALPVLLIGETGVGKDLFARRLHRHSSRASSPMIHVNCAALPETLVESELFGHVKGAFSGAVSDRAGRFEAANGGTIFLDEIGELPLVIQAKLLRTLQNGEIQRLGSDKPNKVDVRIIAATNRDLANMVKLGDFRVDLYHRLSVYPVHIPPLRERDHDVLLLAGYFLESNRSRLGFRSLRLSSASERMLLNYEWPGNIRELEHVVSRAALRAVTQGAKKTDIVTLEPEHFDLDIALSGQVREKNIFSDLQDSDPSPTVTSLKKAVDLYQRQLIQQMFTACHQNWAEVARRLDLDPSNLHKLAKRLGIKA